MVCAGETADEREEGMEREVVRRQLAGMPLGTLVAYEPVWAIGTGKIPLPADAQAMHAFIRSLLPQGENTRILYGGSASADNAALFLAQQDIDGLLCGGASLKPAEFARIVEAAKSAA